MKAAERISRHRRGDYSAGASAYHQGLLAQIDAALVFRPRMSGSAWAEAHGWIPKGTGAESGPVTLYGYQRGLMDAMCDPLVPDISVLKAARVGYTRCFTLAVGYHLHQAPTSCALAQPTEDDAEEFGGIDVARFLQGINAVLASSVPATMAPSPVDALEQAVVQPNTGDTTRIVFTKTLIAYPGGAYEQLVTTWLTKSATPDTNGLVGLGQSASQAAATVVQIRTAALAITP